ncbi:MAG: DUF2726 domain-containing protein [Planctomycetaceae bacterium]|nr:DUF2726 domain-containing protein [Planctomycetaceae bacterium]
MGESERMGCLFAVFRFLGFGDAEPQEAPSLPYERKPELLTKAERSFFGVLQQSVAGRYHVFVKVRLADLLNVRKGTGKWQSHFNRIQSKHIDFVLCEKEQVTPLLAIELDDSSHQRRNRQERDAFLEEALAVADFPLLRIPVRASYNVNQLRQQIEEFTSN